MAALQTIGERDAALATADLIDRTRVYAALSHAQSTRRGYRSDWARFEAWCASKGASALPAEPAGRAVAEKGGRMD
jgi:hypothetical protein